MTTPVPQYFCWDGRAMLPRHSRLAEQSFTSGHCYRLGIVAERDTRRSAEQNRKMWSLLAEISEQAQHFGRKRSPEVWKALFMDEVGHVVEPLLSLDGSRLVGYSAGTSD